MKNLRQSVELTAARRARRRRARRFAIALPVRRAGRVACCRSLACSLSAPWRGDVLAAYVHDAGQSLAFRHRHSVISVGLAQAAAKKTLRRRMEASHSRLMGSGCVVVASKMPGAALPVAWHWRRRVQHSGTGVGDGDNGRGEPDRGDYGHCVSEWA